MNTPLISTGSTLMGLIFMVTLFALALWFIKRSQSSRNTGSGPLRVLATQSIGPGQQLIIVRAGEQTLLVGASAQSVNLICEIDSAWQAHGTAGEPANTATSPALGHMPTGNPAVSGAFTTLLQGMLRR